MVLDRAEPGNLHQAIGRELEHEGHDGEIGPEPLHGGVSLRAPQRRELKDRQPALLRRRLEGVDARPRFLGGAEHARDLVLSLEEGFQHRLAVVLLADDRDLHRG